MKNATNSRRHRTLLALTLLLTTFVQGAGALSLRTVDTHDGLSSMFVLSLYQDDTGYVWAGTYNGVSILEGNNSAVMPLRGGLFASLNGNVIQGIQGSRHGQLWFHSNFGLAHWDAARLEMHRFPDINGNYKFAVSPNDEVIVVSQERGLQYYNTASRQFSTLSFKNLKYPDILAMTIDANHHWFVASRQQVYETEIVTAPDGTCTFRPIRQFDYDGGRITWASIRGEDVFYIDDTGLLCLGNVHRFKPQRLFSVAQLMQRRGSIKAIVRYGDDIVIGFTTDGAVRMHKGAEGGSGEWQEAGLDVKSGVFVGGHRRRGHQVLRRRALRPADGDVPAVALRDLDTRPGHTERPQRRPVDSHEGRRPALLSRLRPENGGFGRGAAPDHRQQRPAPQLRLLPDRGA